MRRVGAGGSYGLLRFAPTAAFVIPRAYGGHLSALPFRARAGSSPWRPLQQVMRRHELLGLSPRQPLRALYVGVANNMRRRPQEHKQKRVAEFTARYNVNWPADAWNDTDVNAAIADERPIKRWSRSRTAALAEAANRDWRDLSGAWE